MREVNTYGRKETGAGEYARFQEMGRRDVQTALRLLLIRDMMHHRNISMEDLARRVGTSRSYLYLLTSGRGWYRLSVPKHDEWMDKMEDAITSLTDSQGGVYGNCKCDPSSLEGIREVLSHHSFS